MKIKKILVLLIIFTLSGCSYRELNELAIATAISIDYKDNTTYVTTQILNFESGEDKDKKEVIIYKGEGENIGKALRNIYKKYPNKIHLGHLELIVLSKSAVENKLDEILDYFLRSPEARSDCNLLITLEDNASDILKPSDDDKNTFTSEEIISSIKSAETFQGTVALSSLQDISKTYLEKGITPAITTVKYTKNKEDYSNVETTNLVGLKNNNTLTKTMNKNTSIAYNTIYENYNDVMIDTKYKDSTVTNLIYNPKSKITINIKNNKITYNININLESHISSVDKEYDLTNKKIISEIEKNIESNINSYIYELIDFCKENEVDLLGLEKLLYKHYYKEYNKYKNKNLYEEEIKVNTNIKLYRYGNTYKSIGD